MRLFILFGLLLSQASYGMHLVNQDAHLDLTTDKVSQISGEIGAGAEMRFFLDRDKTSSIPGPRILLIDSPGGSVAAGQGIIDQIESERSSGVKYVCLVTRNASSMAFNILTHCDVRLAVKDAYMVVHKIFIDGAPGIKLTARNLRLLADQLDKADEPYRQANSKAMHIPLSEYDHKADLDTAWSSEQLLRLHYLHGIVRLR